MPTAAFVSLAPAPVPGPRPWATALTTYVSAVGAAFDTGPNGAQRWLGGIKFFPFGCQVLTGDTVEDFCDTIEPWEPNLLLPEDDDDSCVVFEPFVINTIIENAPLTGLSDAELDTYAGLYSALARSLILAREVQTGSLTADNPSLVGEADTVTGVDTTAIGALAAVEDALGTKLSGGVGMIHMTPGMLTILNSGGGLQFDGTSYRTATGHLVVADAGYVNAAPSTGAVAAGDAWIYGSGPVFAKLGPVTTFGATGERFDRVHNKVTLRIEQYALAYFEPCSVVAAKAETS